jgi:hypothetical protein
LKLGISVLAAVLKFIYMNFNYKRLRKRLPKFNIVNKFINVVCQSFFNKLINYAGGKISGGAGFARDPRYYIFEANYMEYGTVFPVAST